MRTYATLILFILTSCLSFTVCGDSPAAPRSVLLVVTSHAVLGKTGYPTGAWLTEIAHPWQVLVEAGYQVDIASPLGGAVPIDPYSDPNSPMGMTKNDLLAWGFLANPATKMALSKTIPIASVQAASYAAIVVAGGNGAIFDLRSHVPLQKLIARVWDNGGVVAALCHGSAALLDVKLSNGSSLIAGKRITGFSNAEEAIAQKAIGTEYLPFYIETDTKLSGATFVSGQPFQSFTTVDGNGRLITGQQNFSGHALGTLVVEALKNSR